MRVEGWRHAVLGELLREPIRNGYSPNCPAAPTGRWILSLGAVTHAGFSTKGVKPAPPDDPQVTATQLEPGDLVVSRSNTRERVGLAGIYHGIPAPCSYPDLLMRVRTGPQLDIEFLCHVLLSHDGRQYFQRTARGTSGSMVKIDRALLERFPLPVPPLAEQKKIAAIVSSVDDAIDATQAVIDQLAVVKKAMMAELLTRGIPGRHTRFKMTEIGEVPDEWNVVQLSDLAEFVTSGSRGWARFYAETGALFIRITNLTRGTTRLDLASRQHVRLPVGSAEGSRTRVEPGDVLVSITADLGIVGLVPLAGFEEAYVNQHIALVRLDRSKADARYVASVLAGEVGAQQVRRLNDAGAKSGLSLPSIRRLTVPLPPPDEQAALVEPVESAEDRIEAERGTLTALKRVKAALMSVLLTGEVRVKPDGEAA